MRSSRPNRALVSAAVLFAAVALLAPSASAQGNCVGLNGTITGQFQFQGVDVPGWYGQAYLTFGKDKTVVTARLVDLNNGYKDHPAFKPDLSGNFAGDEILTFTVDGVGSFHMKGHFMGVAGTTPYAYQFSETGKLVPETGEGQFAGMTGNLSIHGSFVLGGGLPAIGDQPSADHPWLWIAQITGSVCGTR